MNKLENELEAVKFTIRELEKEKENTNDKELANKIDEKINEFEEYRLELLEKTQVLPKELIEFDYVDTSSQIKDYNINPETIDDISSIIFNMFKDFTEDNQNFVNDNSSWQDLSSEDKEYCSKYAVRILNRLYFKHNIKFFPISWREDDQVSNVKLTNQALNVLRMLFKYAFNHNYIKSEFREKRIDNYTSQEVFYEEK